MAAIRRNNSLHSAAKRGDQLAIKRTMRHTNVNSVNKAGKTALYLACEYRHVLAAELLLMSGADVDCYCHSRTPLQFAAATGSKEIVKLLLSYNANVSAASKDGLTALHEACKNKHVGIVEVLLQHGANADSECAELRAYINTPMDYVFCAYSNLQKTANIADLLFQFGADVNGATSSQMLSYSRANILKVLVRNIVKMQVLNQFLGEGSLKLFEEFQSDFKRSCVNEIARMQSQHIGQSVFTYFDIISKNKSQLQRLFMNKRVANFLKYHSSFRTDFPIHAYVIRKEIVRGLEWKDLVESSSDWLHFALNCKVPHVCAVKIVGYLSYRDLVNVVKARSMEVQAEKNRDREEFDSQCRKKIQLEK